MDRTFKIKLILLTPLMTILAHHAATLPPTQSWVITAIMGFDQSLQNPTWSKFIKIHHLNLTNLKIGV